MMRGRRAVKSSSFQVPEALLAIFIFLIIFNKESSSTGGDPGKSVDKSICRRFHRITATKDVSYTETYLDYDRYSYRHIQHTRINFRQENYTKWERIEMCCDGYEPHQQAEEAVTCVPVCPSDCHNGTCVRPNLCGCNSGYRSEVNNVTEYSECVPICASGCHGGSCALPNVCSCNTGFLLAEDRGSCEAVCSAVGGAGPRGCVLNSSCVAPDSCQCDVGFSAFVNSSSLDNQFFVNEDVATINKTANNAKRETFNTSSVICNPLCHPGCEKNAVCVAPDKCQCRPGYEASVLKRETNESLLCLPICERPCYNGFCGSPNKCDCMEGYKPHHFLKEEFCEPICHVECVNAKCSRPNECECVDGYEKLIVRTGEDEKVSENICVPVCPGQCPNGTCVAPGSCQCNTGYVPVFLQPNETKIDLNGPASNSGTHQVCRPFCEPQCPQGSHCIGPNQCRFDAKKIEQRLWTTDFGEIRAQITNSSETCSDNGVFENENGTCICKYEINDKECRETAVCAIIFANHSEAEKFYGLQSIVYSKNSSLPILVSELPRCTDECQILIVSKNMLEFVDEKTEHCFLLETHNSTTGLISKTLTTSPVHYAKKEETLICSGSSLSGEHLCGPAKSQIVSSRAGGLVGGIVGAFLSLAIIVGLVAIYLARRKRSEIEDFGAICGSNGNILDHSEMIDAPLDIDDNSHL